MKKKSTVVRSTMMKTCALAWAAKRANMTYGHFTANLSFIEEEEVYCEFEQYLKDKEMQEKKRIEMRKRHAMPPNELTSLTNDGGSTERQSAVNTALCDLEMNEILTEEQSSASTEQRERDSGMADMD